MRKTFKYRIYATKEAIVKAENWLELCRELYNCCLSERIYAWKMQRKSIYLYDQQKELPELRKLYPEYKEINSQAVRTPLKRLDLAFRAFFKRAKKNEKPGFPRFKGKNRFNSITFEQCGWKLEGRYLWITNLGRFKMNLSRPIQGNIKTITIGKTPNNKWYACFSCVEVPEKKLPPSDRVIGLDVGIISFLVDSEGNKVDNPKYLKRGLADLRRKQRRLSRRIKGSKRRGKARLLVAKAHEKVTNQRNDFLHKVANTYIQNYGTIVIEDLAIQNMVENHRLARSINDSSWGTFYELLDYKAEEAGRKVIQYPRFNPSSKKCSTCGAINQELKLSDRAWVCQNCGALHDRDWNAAINIQRFGQNHQELTYENTQCVS